MICPTRAAYPQAPPQTLGSHNTVFILDPWFDKSYLKTVPGIIKLTVITFDVIGYLCIQASPFWLNIRGVYFTIVAHLGIWFSTALLVCYLWHVVEKYHTIKWLKIELVGYIALTFLFLIASTIVVAFGSPGYSAAGFFGYLAMVLYGFDAFLKARALQAGELAQGTKVIQQPQHVLTPPALP